MSISTFGSETVFVIAISLVKTRKQSHGESCHALEAGPRYHTGAELSIKTPSWLVDCATNFYPTKTDVQALGQCQDTTLCMYLAPLHTNWQSRGAQLEHGIISLPSL